MPGLVLAVVDGVGIYPDPVLLPGTGITGITTGVNALAAHAHLLSRNAEILAELWFQRAGSWELSPAPLCMDQSRHPALTMRYRQPAMLSAALLDPQGLLAPGNISSPWNQTNGLYDPLLDEARPVMFRVGVRCYSNLLSGLTPASSMNPVSGSLSSLTDSLLAPWSSPQLASTAYGAWSMTANQTLTLNFNLGSLQYARSLLCRFGTGGVSGCTLPASITVSLSTDGVNWTSWPARPVGGSGGDWDDAALNDPFDPCVTEIVIADLNAEARYLQVAILSAGSQTIGSDEILLYGGSQSAWIGRNLFSGYLGDSILYTPEGIASFQAADSLKRLADNNETRLTSPYGNADTADIAYALLTSAGYWPGVSGAYDGPWSSSQIGWTEGTNYSGLLMPVWQGQGNNHLGYQYELWNELGWIFEADGNGVLQARQPPSRQMRPDRVLISAPDGNDDVRYCQRIMSGKDLRNVVAIATGKMGDGYGGGLTLYDPASAARYGRRRVIITDPLAMTSDLQTNLSAAVLRDYAWRINRLKAEIAPDFDTQIRSLHAVRTAQRPALAAKTMTGYRLQEIWNLDSITEHFTPGKWWADAEYIPYLPSAPAPPVMVSAVPASSSPYTIQVNWEPYSGVGIQGFYIYISSAGVNGPWSRQNGGAPILPSITSYTIGPFSAGQQIWAYLTASDIRGRESVPGVTVSALAGGGAQNESTGWTVTDFSAAAGIKTASQQNGVSGETCEFTFLFSSPPVPAPVPDNGMYGLRHFLIAYFVSNLPVNPLDYHNWTVAYQSGRIERMPPGMVGAGGNTLDNRQVAIGQIPWYVRLFTPGGWPSGSTIYWRLWTGNATNAPSSWYASNIANVVV